MRTFSSARSAFTLVELMVICAISAVIGGAAYLVLSTGLNLFAKNTSVNLAHQEARMAMLQMEKEMHLAVSPPRLVDDTGAVVSGNGPAAGMSFQVFAAGPFKVAARAAEGDTSITMALGTYQPKAGQCLIIPSHSVNLSIIANCPGTGDRAVSLSGGIPNDIEVERDEAGVTVPKDVIGFITDRVSYIVKTGDLKYITPTASAGIVLARDITSATPFSKPTNASGNANSRSIAAINLSTGSKSNNGKKKYKSANMFLSAEVPARTLLIDQP